MRFRIALCGFSEFELRALTFSLQQATGSGSVQYEAVAVLSRADFAVVDTDAQAAVREVLAAGRVADSIFVGSRPPQDASWHLPRPIDPTRILRLLDTLAAQYPEGDVAPPPELPPRSASATSEAARRQLAASADPSPNVALMLAPAQVQPEATLAPATLPAPLPLHLDLTELPPTPSRPARFDSRPTPLPAPPQVPAGLDSLVLIASDPEPMGPPVLSPADAKAAARAAARRARLVNTLRRSDSAAEPLRDVLVFDPDVSAGATLCNLLGRFGFVTHLVHTVDDALAALELRRHAAHFLDIPLDGADGGAGLALLRSIQELPVPKGQRSPPALLTTARLAPSDRVNAALAGVGTPLVKPVSRGDAARTLEGFGVILPSDARRI